MRTRTTLQLAVVALSVAACAETPLLGPGPNMGTPPREDIPLGGIPSGRSEISAGLSDERASRVGSGEIERFEENPISRPDEPLPQVEADLTGDDGGLLD